MPGRHRPAAEVRRDGLAAVLGPPLDHPAVRSTALIDVASGMVLAAAGPRADRDGAPDPLADPELLGARHADLVRAAVALLGPAGGRAGDGADGGGTDVLVDAGPAGHHVVRVLPDPLGGHLALTAVVVGTRRVAERVRRRLRRVPAAALTAVPVPGEPWHGPAEGPRPFRVAGPPAPQPLHPQPPVRSWTPTGPPTDPAPGRPPGVLPPARARPATAPSAAPLLAPPPLLRSPGPGQPAAGRPAPAADPAMALLPGVRAGGPPPGAGPARSPAAALEAPAPVVRRLRPVDPPVGGPPVAAPPPSGPAPPAALPPPAGPRALPPAALPPAALPPAPHPPADGGGRGR